MALSINSNIASLNAQRNLTRSQETLNTSLQRLSTGLRINSAKDDAAGLAISTRFTTQINGLNQAVRNANDGISLAQTGEAALDEITNNLQRIRELAVQSANATNTAADRASLDLEVQQRLSEITRIGSQTTFNGQRILDGSFGNAAFQVGANVGETITVALSTGVKSNQIGQIATQQGSQISAANANTAIGTDLTIATGTNSAVTIGASVTTNATDGRVAGSAFAKAEAINAANVSGLTATATTSFTGAFTDVTSASAGETYSLVINGQDIYSGANTTTITAQNVTDQINLFTAQTGVTATNNAGTVTFTASDGRNVDISETNSTGEEGFADAIAGDEVGTLTRNAGQITLTSSENITLSGATDLALIGFTGTTAIAVDSTTLSTQSVTSVANANTTIDRVDAALKSVSDLRSTFGSVQNRFESTITNLQTVSENLSASRSRILDADFAAETANLTKAQILQQAGTAILAQANALPQAALSLLQ